MSPVGGERTKLVRLLLAAALVGGEAALIVPHFSGESFAVTELRWPFVVAAVVAEFGTIMTFARLRRRLLWAGGMDVPLGKMSALTVSSTAIGFTFPGGVAVSAAYLYRQLRRLGGSATLVAWTLATGTVVSVLAFGVLAIAGAILTTGTSFAEIAGAGGVSLLIAVGLVALLGVATRRPEPTLRAVRALCARMPRRRAASCDEREPALGRFAEQLAAITPRWRDWTLVFWLALANWLADLACFVLCCYAVGVDRLGVGAAVLAYVAGLATTSISLLPAGLGNVDAGLLVGLTHAGVAAPVAAVGVLTYRLVAYGLVAAVGWVVWAVLRRRPQAALL